MGGVYLRVTGMDENTNPSFQDVENEPTPYGFSDVSATPARRSRAGSGMGKKRTLVLSIGIACVIIVCAVVGFFIIRHASAPPEAPAVVSTSSTPSAPAPGAPQNVSAITITVQKSGSGSRLFVQWNELPNGTVDINVFYSPTADGTYHLIGSIPVTSYMSGSGYLDVPNGYQNGYYYGVAASGDGSPLWTSSSTISGSGDNNNSSSSATENNNGSQNNGDTDNNGTTTNNNSGTQGNGTSTGQTPPSNPGENFVVEHNNGKIEISWQSLPTATSQLVVSRSASDTDPWTPVLTETNIVTDGPYSILIEDDTLGDPYYYKMDAYDASGTDIATFGPTLLSPL